MLDTRRTPDISDLGGMCRRYLDIAEMLENYACNVTMPNHETSPEAWNDMEKMCSAVSTLTDALREVSAVVSVLDGWADPADYGFPPAPIQKPHTDEYKAGYDAGFYDGLEKAKETAQTILRARKALKAADAAGQDPESAEQLDDLTADEKKEAAADQPTPDDRKDGAEQ
ncbi:MAG: hypothetical protein J6S41_04710 [Clostridia bacterium]|nr:hypothetical protein [Clostridia bacterium]